MLPVAIIGNDTVNNAAMIAAFETAGFSPRLYADVSAALAALRLRSFSLALLGLDIRDTDPFAFCSELSRIVPVITVTRGHDIALCVRALECGADDCIATPIGGRELVARAHSVLRRAARSEPAGRDLSLAVREMRVHDGEVTHELSRGEAEILALLVEHAPSPLTTSVIAARLGAKRGTVESRIKHLRRKLGARLVARGHYGYSVE